MVNNSNTSLEDDDADIANLLQNLIPAALDESPQTHGENDEHVIIYYLKLP